MNFSSIPLFFFSESDTVIYSFIWILEHGWINQRLSNQRSNFCGYFETLSFYSLAQSLVINFKTVAPIHSLRSKTKRELKQCPKRLKIRSKKLFRMFHLMIVDLEFSGSSVAGFLAFSFILLCWCYIEYECSFFNCDIF